MPLASLSADRYQESKLRELPMPPVVYVPCIIDRNGVRRLAMTRTVDGRMALLVYTALDRLVDLVGGDVSWALLDWDALERAREIEHYDVIVQDRKISLEGKR